MGKSCRVEGSKVAPSDPVFWKPNAPERMLVVLFPHWPIVAYPKVHDLASAVFQRGYILAASAPARAQGVGIGQQLREAKRRSPELVLLPRDPYAESHAFTPVINEIAKIAPNLIVREPGWIAVPTRGPTRYVGGEGALVTAVDQALRTVLPTQSSLDAWKMGIAEGSFGATLAAHSRRIIEPGKTPLFLSDLPISLIDDASLSALLERLGINTLGAFGDLSSEDVLARFGMSGFRAHQRARGTELPLQERRLQEEEIVCAQNFDEPIMDSEVLVHFAKGLAEEFLAVLDEQGVRCTICELTIVGSDAATSTRQWQRDRGWRAHEIAERMRWQLDEWITRKGSLEESAVTDGVVALGIRASEVIEEQGCQLSFWDRSRDSDDEIFRVCARLERKLGQGMVMQAELTGGRGPIERVAYRPFGERKREGLSTKRPVAPWPGQLPAPNPSLVHDDLPEIVLTDSRGGAVSVDRRGLLQGMPGRVILGSGQPLLVENWSGPWLVEERWWDRRHVMRCARLQLQLADQRVLLVKSVHSRWHLEGEYD